MNLQIKLVCCLTLLSFVLTQGALDQYDIPEYEYRTLQLNGDDLFFYQGSGDDSEMHMNLGADFMSTFQSPGYNLSYGLTFGYESISISEEEEHDHDDGDHDHEDGDTADWMMNAPFSVDKYFTDNKGIFGFAEGNLLMFGGDTYEGVDDTSDLHLTVGAGYGRVVSARPVAQAYAIADALGIDADDDTILAIAAVIGAASSYGSIYKDDATQQYYNDLAEAAGVDGSAMQIQKVLTSPAYNVSDRFTGCDVRVGITNNYMQCDGCEDAGYMMMEANYAMPMGMDSQLMVSFGYTMDLNDTDTGTMWTNPIWSMLANNISFEEEPEEGDLDEEVLGGWTAMSLGAAYTMDHSYNWSTSAGFNYLSQTYTWVDGDYLADADDAAMLLSVSSTKAILNQMSVTASFTHIIPMGDLDENDPITEISTKVTYWVF
jgi:hypothetical protein